uniref:Uncharacterized protein n=1 Tax=Anguilla anguilla TaxID=7936 RepID=A0A0E9P886_ANGAN
MHFRYMPGGILRDSPRGAPLPAQGPLVAGGSSSWTR